MLPQFEMSSDATIFLASFFVSNLDGSQLFRVQSLKEFSGMWSIRETSSHEAITVLTEYGFTIYSMVTMPSFSVDDPDTPYCHHIVPVKLKQTAM